MKTQYRIMEVTLRNGEKQYFAEEKYGWWDNWHYLTVKVFKSPEEADKWIQDEIGKEVASYKVVKKYEEI